MSSIPDFINELSKRLAKEGDGLASLAAVLAMESELPAMNREDKCDENRFHGCQSQIWLSMRREPADGPMIIRADSDVRSWGQQC